MFQEYDCFKLRKRFGDDSIPVGTAGVVLMVLAGEPSVYEVEFPNGNGGNLGSSVTFTITEEFMEALKGGLELIQVILRDLTWEQT